MEIKKEKNGSVLEVTIEGDLNIKTAPDLEAALEGELDDVTELKFDLAGCSYVSSAGLRVFLGTFQILDEKDGRMVLTNVTDSFYDVLEVTGFTDFLEIER